MDDLISRAAAIEALGECPYNWTDSLEEIAEENAWFRYKDAIEHVSTVDAVPVVRCKDCQYYNDLSDMGKTSYCELHHYEAISGEIYGIRTKPDDYCSWAEKEEC